MTTKKVTTVRAKSHLDELSLRLAERYKDVVETEGLAEIDALAVAARAPENAWDTQEPIPEPDSQPG